MLLSWVLLSLISAQITNNCQHDETTFRCVKYIKNYDADTITFDIPGVPSILGKKIKVRLKHVDAPEVKSQNICEKQAARTAQRLIEHQLKNAKQIHLKNIAKDKYFRLLADVEIDGKDLKEILLKNHLATPYEGQKKTSQNWCHRAPASK